MFSFIVFLFIFTTPSKTQHFSYIIDPDYAFPPNSSIFYNLSDVFLSINQLSVEANGEILLYYKPNMTLLHDQSVNVSHNINLKSYFPEQARISLIKNGIFNVDENKTFTLENLAINFNFDGEFFQISIFRVYFNSEFYVYNCNISLIQTDNVNSLILYEKANNSEIHNISVTAPENKKNNFLSFFAGGEVKNMTINQSIFENLNLYSQKFFNFYGISLRLSSVSFENISMNEFDSIFIYFQGTSYSIFDLKYCEFSKIEGNSTHLTMILSENTNISNNLFNSIHLWTQMIYLTNGVSIYIYSNIITNCSSFPIYVRDFTDMNITKLTISESLAPAIQILKGLNLSQFDSKLIFEQITLMNIKNFNNYDNLAIVNIDLQVDYQINFSNNNFLYTTEKTMIHQNLVKINAKLSKFFARNLIFSHNSNLLRLLEIYALESSLFSSLFFNNTNLQASLMKYAVNKILEYSLAIHSNQALITMNDVTPYDKTSFQIYQGSQIHCLSNTVELFGGCIHFKPPYQGNHTLSDSKFENCQSNYVSGALDIFSTTPSYEEACYYIFTNLTFLNNSASFQGGASAMFFHDFKYIIIMENCQFINNQARKGGALMFDLDSQSNLVQIFSCNFTMNSADSGATMSLFSGTLQVFSSEFRGNSATRGGALETLNSNIVYLTSCRFNNNTATVYGGIISLLDHSQGFLEEVLIEDFEANFGGIAYIDSNSIFSIISSSFFNGSGKSGALIYISNGELHCRNSSFMNISSENSLVFVDNSIINFEDIALNNSVSTIFDLNGATANFKNIAISNAVCYGDDQEGCVFSEQDACALEILNLNLTNILFSNGAIFYLIQSSSIIMNNSFLMNIANENSGSLFFIDSSQAKFSQIDIYNISCYLVYGFSSTIILEMIYFENPTDFMSENSYLNIDSCPLFLIQNSDFQKLSSKTNGGFLYVSNEEYNIVNNSIINCNFSFINGNIGGVIYVENTLLEINSSNFVNNSAIDGGSIYFQCDLTLNFECFLNLFNNSFINNLAENHGGAIKWAFKKPVGFSPMLNSFKGNLAKNYGNDIASFPIKLAVKIYNSSNTSQVFFTLQDSLNKTLRSLIGSSGEKLDFTMEFFLIDEKNQIIKEIDQAKLYIDIINVNDEEYEVVRSRFNLTHQNHTELVNYTSNLTDISGQTSQNINETTWSFVFDDLTLTAKPSTSVFLKITSLEISTFRNDLFPASYPLNHFNLNLSQYTYYLPIEIHACSLGERYDNLTNTCYKCPRGTYSYYIFDETCKNCLDHAICYGVDNMKIEEGYWRSSITSEMIYRCTANLYLCKGGINSTCLNGYFGRLCEICDDINGHRANKNYFGLCQECADIGINILISIPMMIGVLIILKILANFFSRIDDKYKAIDCAMIKLLILHYQMLTLIPNVNTSFGQTPNQILGGLTRNWFSFDCVFGMAFDFPSELNSRMLSLTSILVIFAFFSNFALYRWRTQYWKNILAVIMKFKKFLIPQTMNNNNNYNYGKAPSNSETPSIIIAKNPTLKSQTTLIDEKIVNILTYNSIWLYLIQSSMLDLAFLGMRCADIDGVSYNRYSLNYECWTTDHILWIIFLYVPNILIWSVGVTWAMKKWLNIVRNFKKKNIIIASVGCKKKFRLWGDVMNLTRKSLVIIINTYSNENSETIPFTIFLLTSFMLLLHFYTRPYNYKVLNNLDAFSLYIVFSTYYTLSYYYTSIDETLAIFFYDLLIIMHVIFAFLWIIVFFRRQIKTLIKRITSKKLSEVYPNKKHKPN